VSKTCKTSVQQLWNTSSDTYKYYGEVQYSATRNELNNTYTIKVTGIRAHGGKWNFRTNWEISIGSSKKTGTIPSSGSNTYSGWLPKSGYQTVGLTHTVNGDSSGKCPAVNLTVKCYNSSVKWLSAGKYISVNVSATHNIAASVQSDSGGPNDRTAPTITATKSSCTTNSVTFKGSANVTCGSWQYSLNGGAWKTSTLSGKGGTQTVTVSTSSPTIRLKAVKSSNGVSGQSSTITFDCVKPTIQLSAALASGGKVTLTASSADSCKDWQVKIDTGSWTTFKTVSTKQTTYTTSALSAGKHTFSVRATKVSNGIVGTSSVQSVDMSCPKITLTPTKSLFTYRNISFVATSDVPCDTWQYKIDSGNWVNVSTSNNKKIEVKNIKVSVVAPVVTVRARDITRHTTGTSSAVECDTAIPLIETLSLKATSNPGTKATLQFRVYNYPCSYVLSTVGDNGKSATVYKGSFTKKASGSTQTITVENISVTADDRNITNGKYYTLTVTRSDCPLISESQNTEYYAERPAVRHGPTNAPKEGFIINPVARCKVQLEFWTWCKFRWQLEGPDGSCYSTNGKNTWSNECIALTTYKPVIQFDKSTTNDKGTFKLHIKRVVNEILKSTYSAECDSSIPQINTFTLNPTANRLGTMTLKTNYNCGWSFKGASTVQSAEGSLKCPPTVASKLLQVTDMPLRANSNSSYEVEVWRLDCNALKNKATVTCDTTESAIQIVDVQTGGNICSFRATAQQPMTDWYCSIVMKDGSTSPLSQSRMIVASDGKSATKTVSKIPPAKPFDIRVSAKAANNVTSSVTAGPYQCTGVVRIYDSGWKYGTVFINKSTDYGKPNWTIAQPYVWSGGSWKICK